MIELIKKVFTDSEFQIDNTIGKSNDNYQMFFAKRTEKDKFDFYLIMNLEEDNLQLNELEKVFDDVLDEILYTYEYPGLDKNLSLLLIVKRQVLEYTEEFSRQVYDFEEDPFHFKKYILPYTAKQNDVLQERLDFKKNIIKQLDPMVSNKQLFSSFKENRDMKEFNNTMLYDLISKIYIKLPFLKLKVNKEDLPNISREIDSEISAEDKEIVNEFLKMENEDIEWEEIQVALGVKPNEL